MKKDKKTILKKEKISTGIKEIDDMSGGGFEYNSTNLVIGDGGTGKTIFGVQFLIEGIKQGEKCLYVTFEEKKSAFFSNMNELGFDLEKLEKEEKFFFIEYTPEKVKSMLEEGGGVIESIILVKKISRVVIDSMNSFGLLFENEMNKRQSLLSLFNMLKKWECTTLLTYDKDMLDNKIAPDILELESDSVIVFYFIRRKEERERFFEILKMRGTKHSSLLIGFTIGEGGITIKKDSVSNDTILIKKDSVF